MIIPDINLLLYAVITGFPQHRRAHAWWQDTVNGHTRIGLTYPALFGFLRIATSARVLAAPLPTADAIAYVREWLSQPNVDLPRRVRATWTSRWACSTSSAQPAT